MTIDDIAHICYEVDRIYRYSHGNDSQPPWESASPEEVLRTTRCVAIAIAQEAASSVHEAWRLHNSGPLDVPFEDLPLAIQAQHKLFWTLATMLNEHINEEVPM